HQDVSYAFINCFVEGVEPAQGRWSEGPSMDGKGEFSLVAGSPMGEEPILSPPRPSSGAQSEQMIDRRAAE
ncbi:catalase, partial [Mesorhizobium sp. M7A.F.Ca.US.002.01.1.1]